MNWTACELRELRRRLGWSQAEMARTLGCDMQQVSLWEVGQCEPSSEQRQKMARFHHEAESQSAKVQRRAVAETLMADRNLAQIHDADVLECLAQGELRSLRFIEK